MNKIKALINKFEMWLLNIKFDKLNEIKQETNMNIPKLPSSEKVLSILRVVGYVIAIILGICLLLIPYILISKYLQSKGQKIQIHPEFNIVDVENNNTVDNNTLSDAVRVGNEILARIKKEDLK